MSVETGFSHSTEKLQRWCSRGVVWGYLDLTRREITICRMKVCSEKLHKLLFTKPECDDQGTRDRDTKSGNMKGWYIYVDLEADWWVTLTYILKRQERKGVGRFHLAQNTDQ
jgi:hypothetical protein